MHPIVRKTMLSNVDQAKLHDKNRIMIVDDEEFCLTTMKSMLFNLGIDIMNQVDSCINGLEALDTLKSAYKSNQSYKIIFTDFSMPVMGGIESITKMRSYLGEDLNIPRSEQPIIIGITGHVLVKCKNDGLNAGMD